MDRRIGLRLAIAALIAAAACAPPADEPSAGAGGPVGRTDYARRLAAAAGGPIPVERFVEIAEGAARRIERQMNRLAVELGEEEGWRPLFERLRLGAPADEAAVLAAYRAEMSRAADYTRERSLVSLPAALPEVLVLENRSLRAHFPLALYHDGRFAVTTRSADDDDPAYLANHCHACIPPLAVHEGYPGHHVAFARMAGAAGEAPSVAELARYKPFVEGWALYAELLMIEQAYYRLPGREPGDELAALRMLLLRVRRAEIDARLHDGSLEPSAAEEAYHRSLLMTPAAAAAEVRTHLAKPTVKASYLLGLLQILELRQLFRRAHPEAPPLVFHDRLLGPPGTIPGIARRRLEIELPPLGGVPLPWPWSPRGDAVAGSFEPWPAGVGDG